MATKQLTPWQSDPHLEKMTDQERSFCHHLRADAKFHPTLAAEKAGYKSPRKAAHAVLKRSRVRAYLGKLDQLDAEALELDRHETLWQLWCALTRNASDFCDENGFLLRPHQLPPQCQSIVDGFEQEVTEYPNAENAAKTRRVTKTKYKLTPHATAREQAMKHKGLFEPEQVDHTHRMQFDWNKLRQPILVEDEVEKRLQAEEAPALVVDGEPPAGLGVENTGDTADDEG